MRVNYWWLCPRCLLRELWCRIHYVDAIRDAAKWSHEQTIRPFSDKYDESAGGGGYFGAGGAQYDYKRGLCEQARQILARPPAPPHPRARKKED